MASTESPATGMDGHDNCLIFSQLYNDIYTQLYSCQQDLKKTKIEYMAQSLEMRHLMEELQVKLADVARLQVEVEDKNFEIDRLRLELEERNSVLAEYQRELEHVNSVYTDSRNYFRDRATYEEDDFASSDGENRESDSNSVSLIYDMDTGTIRLDQGLFSNLRDISSPVHNLPTGGEQPESLDDRQSTLVPLTNAGELDQLLMNAQLPASQHLETFGNGSSAIDPDWYDQVKTSVKRPAECPSKVMSATVHFLNIFKAPRSAKGSFDLETHEFEMKRMDDGWVNLLLKNVPLTDKRLSMLQEFGIRAEDDDNFYIVDAKCLGLKRMVTAMCKTYTQLRDMIPID